jgi:spermidine/putrescine transport system ATP-binding protein
MKIIELKHVTRQYPDGFTALHDLNLSLESGKFYSLLGPSGSGKTTILRLIAGFDQPTQGEILFNGRKINDLPAAQRPLNTVFQNYALFPHLNVFENIAFGLKVKKVPADQIQVKVDRMLSLVRLEGFGQRSVQELSGGQQQRVAIARALVNQPKVLLLDESLSALDKKLRKTMQFELRSIQKQLGITFIFVTHDQEEALAMSDEIFVLNEGRLQQSGSPSAIYDEPVNEFVARFIGDSNLLMGHMIRDFEVEFDNHRFECADAGIKPGEQVQVLLRPEDLSLVAPQQGKIVVEVLSQLFLGDHYEIWAKDDAGFNWLIHTVEKAPTKRCGLHFAPDAIHVMRLGESESEFDQRLSQYEDHEK